ncbi:MAG: 5'-methylthioadenosine/adenosylhomocysteine nucleosidase [Ruminococcus sp.]|nr:5'-methylthioadenosine/adenosylhomocysteine nucleosidase [Ruminococcus sp.]
MLGIICAMQVEADGILKLASNTQEEIINNMRFIRGTLNGKDIVVVVCGVGKVNAALCATTMINRFSPELIVNSGVAGALSPLVSIGDLVVASKAVEHDMNTTALGDKQGEISLPDGKIMYFECDKDAVALLTKCGKELPDTKVTQGIVASGDMFVSNRRKRLLINDRFGAMACEMEGAAIGHVCYCCKVPFAILRAISDDMDENKGVDFVKFCSLAAEKTVRVMDEFTKNL